jgi:hypothetical protein
MILDIPALLVRHDVVARAAAQQLHVAFLRTTEPTFLVFGARQRHPLFVVKIGQCGPLAARSAITSRLHVLLPDTIARPIGVFPLDAERALFVEEGLPGVPWFRFGDRCKTPDDWRALRSSAIDRLRHFHAAVATEAAWIAAPRALDVEVRDMAGRLGEELAHVDGRAEAMIEGVSSELAALGAVGSISQHGDFVLNNLLVDEQRLYILDFADFGKWRVPFLDAFALAHSVNLLAREHVRWPHLSDDLAACAAAETAGDAFSPRQKVALFVYFLLAAMIDTLHKPTRSDIRLIYRATFRDLLDETARYEQAFAVTSPSRM